MDNFMKIAVDSARNGMINNEGGPFGCVIVDKSGNVISSGNNRVLIDVDPTAHAEIVAIRNASKKLNTYDLSNLILYSSCKPCPMCLSAIIWSNIKQVYYGCDSEDAASIGFRDDLIYNYFFNKSDDILSMSHLCNSECISLFEEYKKLNKTIY